MTPALPDRMLFGLGGQRCGSSWLHGHLVRHPSIRAPGRVKEVHFFDLYYDRGRDWYAGLYQDSPGSVWWDATPYYLYDRNVPERIADCIRDPRFVLLLRDPVARSLSHYRRYLANSGRATGFMAAVAARPSILGFSKYSQYLAPYIARFGAQRIFVGLFEDLERRPEALLQDILDFLELPRMKISQSELGARVNGARQPRRPVLHAVTETGKRWMQRNGLGDVVAVGRSLGLRDVVTAAVPPAEPPPLHPIEQDLLDRLRYREVVNLGRLGVDVRHWTSGASPPAALYEAGSAARSALSS